MQQVALQPASPYSEDFLARRKERLAEPVWLIERRQAAIDGFEARGFPTRKHEAWRNLDLTALRQGHFPPARLPGEADALAKALAAAAPGAYRMVFVDGEFSEPHSDLAGLPAGVSLMPLRYALERHAGGLEQTLARNAFDGQPFAALNTALFEDGVCLRVGRCVRLEKPLVIAYLTSVEAAGHAVYPRTLVVAEEGAELSLAEFHQGTGAYLSCPVVELEIGANARVRYHKLQEESPEASHFGVIGARLERDARLYLHSLALGGKQARTDIHVDLTAPGAEAELDGLYLAVDGQYLDHHTWVQHLSEHGTSRQRFKGVLNGKSETVFDGLVKVAKGAQKTDARQENRNLLLSKRALAHSNPRLEIYADDVKCSHGSSVGELDAEALFYLRSRGLSPQDAQGLLTLAFVGELLDAIGDEALRTYARSRTLARLPGESLKETA